MKNTFVFLALLTLFFGAAAHSSDIELCETYKEKANTLRCQSDNYLLQFGYKYCQAYVLKEYYYLPETQQMLARIRKCLVDELKFDETITCRNSETKAMTSHLKCYVESGFCETDAFDQLLIFQVAVKEIRRTSFQKTMKQVALMCAQRRF